MSPTTIKPTQVVMQSARYLCPTLNKFGVSRQIFIKVPNIKFHGHPSSASRADKRGQTHE
jgi:hypothetical protein